MSCGPRKRALANRHTIEASFLNIFCLTGPAHWFSKWGGQSYSTFSISLKRLHGGRRRGKFWFSRTQENAFLEAISKNFVFIPHVFCSAEKWRGHGSPPPPVALALSNKGLMQKTRGRGRVGYETSVSGAA